MAQYGTGNDMPREILKACWSKRELDVMTNKPVRLYKNEPINININPNIVLPGAIAIGMLMLFIAMRFVESYTFLIAGI